MNQKEHQQIQEARPAFLRLVQAGVLRMEDKKEPLQSILEKLLYAERELEGNLNKIYLEEKDMNKCNLIKDEPLKDSSGQFTSRMYYRAVKKVDYVQTWTKERAKYFTEIKANPFK